MRLLSTSLATPLGVLAQGRWGFGLRQAAIVLIATVIAMGVRNLLTPWLGNGLPFITAFPAVAIVPRPSSLERRVTAMLNAHINRRPVSRTSRLATLALLLAAVLPIALFAQNRFSTISGTIVDPSNAFLPGVTVEATNPALTDVRSGVTDGAGQYRIVDLRPGVYALKFSLPGFSVVQRPGI